MTYGRGDREMVILFPKETLVCTLVLEVTLWYISPPSEGYTGQIARGVESDKRNASLHICFTSKIHKQNVFSQPPCGSIPSAFIKIDLPFEAMCSLKWQDFSLQRRVLRNWPPDNAESPLTLCYLIITAGTKLLMLSLNRHVIGRLNHQQRHIDLKIYMCVYILELHNS